MVAEQQTKVLHNDIRVIVGLQEPVGLRQVVSVDVAERRLRLPPEVVATFGDVELDGGQDWVISRAHEKQGVASATRVQTFSKMIKQFSNSRIQSEELRKRLDIEDVADVIRKSRLRWFGEKR